MKAWEPPVIMTIDEANYFIGKKTELKEKDEQIEILLQIAKEQKSLIDLAQKALEAFDGWWRLPQSKRNLDTIEPAMRLAFDALAMIMKKI